MSRTSGGDCDLAVLVTAMPSFAHDPADALNTDIAEEYNHKHAACIAAEYADDGLLVLLCHKS